MIRALVVWVLSAGLALAQVPKPEEVVLVNAEFELWQRAAVVLARQHVGKADQRKATFFALGRVAAGEDALDIEDLLVLAETWLVAERDGALPASLIAAGVDGDLARRVLCYVAGEGPGRAHRLIGEYGSPRGSIDCEATMAEAIDAAETAYRAYPAGDGTRIVPRYGKDRWSRLAARHELLEEIADRLAAEFAWPAGLAVAIVPCDAAEKHDRPTAGTITLCAETIGRYHALADGRIGY